ncbi:hypothetical protein JL722_12346 [Aureococcus anophagefferens]|nr:hypothetical protein JL722_12346 [Aureococcus anophagefferens]
MGDADVDMKAAAEAGAALEGAKAAPTILTDEELPAETSQSKDDARGVLFADAPASAAEAKGGSEAKDAAPSMSVEVKTAAPTTPSAADAKATEADAKQASVALSSRQESDLMNSSAPRLARGVGRVPHVAEDRAKKKIAETKARTSEIVHLKQRNLEYQSSKQKLHTERELSISATRKAVTLTRQTTRRHVRESRAGVAQQRRDHAMRMKSKMAELNSFHEREMAGLVQKNKGLNAQALARRADAKAKRDELRAAEDRRRKEEYAKQIQLESTRAVEAERLIQEMTLHEHRLMERLKATQNAQTKAYEDLQTSLQL